MNFFNFNKDNSKINKIVKELIKFTKEKNPESFKIMDILPELDKIKPTEADLDALEEAFNERNNWSPLNRDFWEKLIVDILIANGRKIKN